LEARASLLTFAASTLPEYAIAINTPFAFILRGN
jgi:hypothetical protein